MSVFSRLFNILKSNLANDVPPDSERMPGGGSGRARSQRATRPARDATLAAYYANLEVPYGSDLDTVRKAYRRLVREYHPDVHSGDEAKAKLANEIVQRLNHAYKELEKHLKK